MKRSNRVRRRIQAVKHTVTFNLDVITFEEEGICYMQCPPLDITGYGYTSKEAETSFEIMLQEFLRYTINKRTLFVELERLGWQKQQKNTIVPPSIETVKETNNDLSRIMNNIPFQSRKTSVALPCC